MYNQSRQNNELIHTHIHTQIKNSKTNRHTNIVSLYLFSCRFCVRISHMTVIKSKGCVIKYPFQPCCRCKCVCVSVCRGYQSNSRFTLSPTITPPRPTSVCVLFVRCASTYFRTCSSFLYTYNTELSFLTRTPILFATNTHTPSQTYTHTLAPNLVIHIRS